MAKKRKASGAHAGRFGAKKDEPAKMNSRFAADERFEDSGDEFEAGRDRILLEEAPEAKRRRKLAEDEEFFQSSDEEVLGYESESLDEDDLDDNIDEEDEDEGDEEPTRKKSTKSRARESASPDFDEDAKEDEEEGLEGWGSSKKDYYNADVIETEADALEEEEEAKKIQQKRLESMAEADFGFDELDWATSRQTDQTAGAKENGVVTEVLPELQVTDNMSAAERLKILKQRYPEFEPLSRDFIALQPIHAELTAAAKSAEEDIDSAEPSHDTQYTPVSIVKFRAVSTYLAAISMYFFLLTSTARDGDHKPAMPPAKLRDHPIMDTLIKCKSQWEEVQELQESEASEPEDIDEESEEELTTILEPTITEIKPATELDSQKKPKRTKAEKAAAKAQAIADAHRDEKIQQTEKGLAELSRLLDRKPSKNSSTQPKSRQQPQDDDSDFGDETGLTAHEAEEKARKKKSLRFYTSQIAQKSNKRDAAGRDAGGDADLPYRERLKDRQARLNVEAERRGRKEANELEKLGGDSDDDDNRLAKQIRGDGGEDDDDYYDMVAARTQQKKTDKKKLAEAYAEAARAGGEVHIQEQIGTDGKRAITYAIQKNKGLTPKRNKDVRNPRVKKRKKYEEKKKKLGSMRAIYKGGEGPGGYGGELTGIKKNVVKSVKL
ncbi:hypothetical protein AJ80_03161 [Polytolypa hystricis UAMH7299]|uniref:Sas10 C-terminal domain-containing protein n=1 Tax=Polytolypa hystricis (strain UAMH7299) TaxID=1447883 RepID=A0A2B7YKF7_POLH7|nr:hypothetical protein AJ80_03161 [Polytolypa hystricis UAMH7299]